LEIPPSKTYELGFLKFPAIFIFFTDLYLFVFFLFYFLLGKISGILFASAVSLYFLLRFAGLTHPIFLVIILSLLLTLELFFYRKR